MSRAYHVSREEGRSLSDGEERPYASMYLQQFMSVLGNAKSATRPTLQHPSQTLARVNGYDSFAALTAAYFAWTTLA